MKLAVPHTHRKFCFPLRQLGWLSILTLGMGGLASCAGFSDFGSDDLRGRDRNAIHSKGSIALDVWNLTAKREDDKPGGQAARSPWGPVSLEMSFDAASGDFTAPAGAAWSTADYDLLEIAAAARSGIVIGQDERLLVRGLLGIGWNHASFDVERPSAPSAHGSSDRLGVLTGAEIGFMPFSKLRLYARSTLFLSVDTFSQKAEAGIEIPFAGQQAYIFAGFRHWSFERDNISLLTGSSDIDLRSQGILVGLGLRF